MTALALARLSRTLLALAATGVLLGLALGLIDRASLERANRIYRHGAVDVAAEIYRGRADAEDARPVVLYNLGTALLAAGSEADAEAALRRGLASPDSATLYRAHHNLGYLYLVQGLRHPAPDSAVRLLAASVAANRAALRRHPGAPRTIGNLVLAQQALDSLSTLLASSRSAREELVEEAIREAARSFAQGRSSGSEQSDRPVTDSVPGERSSMRGDPGQGAREALASAEDPGPLSAAAAREIMAAVRDDPVRLIRGILWSQGPRGWWWDSPARGGQW